MNLLRSRPCRFPNVDPLLLLPHMLKPPPQKGTQPLHAMMTCSVKVNTDERIFRGSPC
ncbi:hypothetical protein F383_29392 [Gossypium arboreum]|uniref:Uncharacterized protein n=1 Tax=Gossypium arboreum TaxID=29729 RepID=A0A0B0PIJ4_GOSAR|nr:hypothetical protein F383_29392 [Gossypium arboreum]